jgi:putative membrane protein
MAAQAGQKARRSSGQALCKQVLPLVAAGVLCALANGASATGNSASGPPWSAPASAGLASSLSPQDRAFIENAAESGRAEVQASRLAVRRASDPNVRSFAQRMVTDHTTANAQLQEIARAGGVMIPADGTVAQQSGIAILEAATGSEFDNVYERNFGVSAHEKAIALFRKEAGEGKNPRVKEFARDTLPTLQTHLQLARNVQAGKEAQAARPAQMPSSSRK